MVVGVYETTRVLCYYYAAVGEANCVKPATHPKVLKFVSVLKSVHFFSDLRAVLCMRGRYSRLENTKWCGKGLTNAEATGVLRSARPAGKIHTIQDIRLHGQLLFVCATIITKFEC